MKKLSLLGIPILLIAVISSVLFFKNTSNANPNSLTPERIYEIHKEYIESTYGPGTGFRIDSYGESGIGYVNHETGDVTWDATENEK